MLPDKNICYVKKNQGWLFFWGNQPFCLTLFFWPNIVKLCPKVVILSDSNNKESTCCIISPKIDDVFYSGFAPKSETAEWKADKVVPKSPERVLQETQTRVENRRHRPEVRRFCTLIREASLKKVQVCSKKRQNVRETFRTFGCSFVRLFECLLMQGGITSGESSERFGSANKAKKVKNI